MSREQRRYDQEYKVQAIKLAQEFGSVSRAASELGMPDDTLYGWISAVHKGRLDIGPGAHVPYTICVPVLSDSGEICGVQ